MQSPRTGPDLLNALAATGDRSTDPVFVECLEDPEHDVQLTAIDIAGRLRLRAAVPRLKRLVRGSTIDVRARAIAALAQIDAPGTKDFLREHLRDNPDAAAKALARRGAADCAPAIAELLAEQVQPGPMLAALDVLAHPQAYKRIDEPLNAGPGTLPLGALPGLVATASGVRCRLSPGAGRALERGEISVWVYCAKSLRDVLATLVTMQSSSGQRFTHVHREGTLEICLVEEALALRRVRR